MVDKLERLVWLSPFILLTCSSGAAALTTGKIYAGALGLLVFTSQTVSNFNDHTKVYFSPGGKQGQSYFLARECCSEK